MLKHFHLKYVVPCVVALLASGVGRTTVAEENGATRVAGWKDNKPAAFLLMFDDSAPTDVKNVVPELEKRGMVGTFYVNPGSGHWKAFKNAWENEIPAKGMEYANHTFTHKGAKDLPDAEAEIKQCNDVIRKIFHLDEDALISFGKPGVKPGAWNISDPQLDQLLKDHHLIDRGTFGGHGAVVNLKDADAIMRLVDSAISKRGLEYVIFHGVGGDWIVFPLPEFTSFLDKLAAKKDQVWITGHISAHKYQTERDSANVRLLKADAGEIRLALTCGADPKRYNVPLTLMTRVPAAWKNCRVVQGRTVSSIATADGVVMYEARPDGETVTIVAQ